MKWRPVRISLLLFQVLWLVVIVPGHQRGAITLPGSTAGCCAPTLAEANASSQSCCSSTKKHSESDSETPDPTRLAHCAVCHYAIRTVFFTPPDFSIEPAGFVELLPVPATRSQPVQHVFHAHDARGPPAV